MLNLKEQHTDLLIAASLAEQMMAKDKEARVASRMFNHTDVPELKEYNQKVADQAIGERMVLQVQYANVLRRINERFVPVEKQMNNARPLTNMECAEAYALAIKTLN